MKVLERWVDEFVFNPKLSTEEGESDEGLLTIDKIKIKKPSRYQVLLHNDDYTTMEFVVFILQTIFGKNFEQAQAVMLKVHNDGVGVCGVYTYEIAETKASKVTQLAKENGHPLLCTIEPE